MKLGRKLFVAAVFILLGWAQYSQACSPINPHSLSCMHTVFNGAPVPFLGTLPQVPISDGQMWAENWHPNLFTASEGKFRNRVIAKPNDRFREHRTCGLRNSKTRQTITNLEISYSGAFSVREVRIERWSPEGKTVQSQWTKTENDLTISFGAGDESFRCINFMRAGNPHLLCQYFQSKEFVGYLGFLQPRDRPLCNR